MKIVVTEKQKVEMRKYIHKWRDRLFLHQWNFDIQYHDDHEAQGLKITMKTEYKDALIEVHEDFWKLDKGKREEMIVHELCHCIVQPLVEIACRSAEGQALSQREIDWHKETVTQHLARAIYNG